MKHVCKLVTLLSGLLLLAGCGDKGKDQPQAVTQKVSLDFHIMSKCPFGVKVMEAVTPVLEKMGDNVNFNVYYIGREQNGELKSMHGEPEVQGNLLQLCARATGDTAAWLQFMKCQNTEWRKIPEGWETCATSAKLDVAKMKSCYEGDQGKKLLSDSFKTSTQKKAKGSPTIFLNGQAYTGGRTEDAFARALCAEFKGQKPAYCGAIPEPTKVPVTVVTDKRCTERTCNPRRFLTFVRNTFEGADIRTIDYAEPEGKALYEKSGEKFLPIAVFAADVEKVEEGFHRLKRRFKKLDSGEYVYPLGDHGRPPWNPAAEICSDGIDNTGDGVVDCDDETCKGSKDCRPETLKRVDLFVMSQCPYGVRTVDAVAPVLEHFGKDRNRFDFVMQFIGTDREGKLSSMHGPREVEEDMRQLCAQKLYAKNYKFMEYVQCRNAAFNENHGREEANAWETCAKNGIAAAAIRKCAEGPEGQALLAASFKLASDTGMTGSPSWLLNNRFDMRARAAQQIKSEFCQKNAGVPGCDKELVLDPSLAQQPPIPAGSCGGGGPAPAPRSAMGAPAGAIPGPPSGTPPPLPANAKKAPAPAAVQ